MVEGEVKEVTLYPPARLRLSVTIHLFRGGRRLTSGFLWF